MDYNTYKTARESLLVRLYNAQKALCPRTAYARAKDMARLDSSFYGKDYDEALQDIIEHCNITKTYD